MASILFVDDDPLTLEIMTRAAEVLGHQAVLANNGQEALKISGELPLHLIFIDLSLHDIDGLTLISLLRQNAATAIVPIMILSASPELDIKEQAQSAGAQDYLHKPIRLQTLQDIIQRYVPAD